MGLARRRHSRLHSLQRRLRVRRQQTRQKCASSNAKRLREHGVALDDEGTAVDDGDRGAQVNTNALQTPGVHRRRPARICPIRRTHTQSAPTSFAPVTHQARDVQRIPAMRAKGTGKGRCNYAAPLPQTWQVSVPNFARNPPPLVTHPRRILGTWRSFPPCTARRRPGCLDGHWCKADVVPAAAKGQA